VHYLSCRSEATDNNNLKQQQRTMSNSTALTLSSAIEGLSFEFTPDNSGGVIVTEFTPDFMVAVVSHMTTAGAAYLIEELELNGFETPMQTAGYSQLARLVEHNAKLIILGDDANVVNA
jgi:hypothetical protein